MTLKSLSSALFSLTASNCCTGKVVADRMRKTLEDRSIPEKNWKKPCSSSSENNQNAHRPVDYYSMSVVFLTGYTDFLL